MMMVRTASVPVKCESDADSFADELGRVVFSPAADDDDAFDLHPVIDDSPADPGTDGPWIDFEPPTEPVDEEDAEWAARNLNDSGYLVAGEPDGSAIELFTVSAWDRYIDELAADREAEARYEAGIFAC